MFGCAIYAGACNYNPSATVNDGSCDFCCIDFCPDEGCTDPEALNYNPLATIDDGSCIYIVCDGCPLVSGCTDITACNYNPLAAEDVWKLSI